MSKVLKLLGITLRPVIHHVDPKWQKAITRKADAQCRCKSTGGVNVVLCVLAYRGQGYLSIQRIGVEVLA